MRGLAVLLMIQCHTFNSFARADVREDGAYTFSQFIGGMAAPLFLFMSGMTLAFQMDRLERREPDPIRRWKAALWRGGYILGIAYAFRISNFVASLPHPDPNEIIKVDILNCMGLGMAALSVGAILKGKQRARFAAGAGLGIALAAPLVAGLPWEHAPGLVRDYIAPSTSRGFFGFFPCAAYIGFGLAAGTVVKQTALDRFDRLMQWSVLIGLALVFAGQYLANIPYSIYRHSNFWSDSPTLIVIRAGISLLLMTGAYLWTEYCAGERWSWIQCLGRNSLMVYWVHLMLVYGDIIKPAKRALTIRQTTAAAAGVTALMVGLSAWWLWWKGRDRERGPRLKFLVWRDRSARANP